MTGDFSRRDFLKVSALALGGLALSPYFPIEDDDDIEPGSENERYSNPQVFDRVEILFTADDLEKVFSSIEKLAEGTEVLSNQPEHDSDFDILKGFRREDFLENVKYMVNRIDRLKHTYSEVLKDDNLDKDIKKQTLGLIKVSFARLSPILKAFCEQDVEGIDPKVYSKKLIYDIVVRKRDEVPVDPIIGDKIYSWIGTQLWFNDFDLRAEIEEGSYGVYPFTRRFFANSGITLKHLSSRLAGRIEGSDYPSDRPDLYTVVPTETPLAYLDTDEVNRFIKVTDEVKKVIYDELERVGLDRSFISLAFTQNTVGPTSAGFVLHDSDAYKHWVHIGLNDKDELDLSSFKPFKDDILFIIKHEVAHVLMNKISEMSDKDAFILLSYLQLLYRSINPIYSKGEIPNERQLNFKQVKGNLINDGVQLIRQMRQFPNESMRNRYFFRIILATFRY